MRVHHLRHVEFENLGSIETWLRAAGHQLTETRQYLNEKLPSVDDFDWLIVMGGPMGANDDATLSWLVPEKALISRSIAAGKQVLGVCLGAQLIATVLGAKVFKNIHREIGWFEIRRLAEASQHPLGKVLPERMDVFHWHGDTFDLPSGAVRLASSDACLNQAFSFNNNVLALQFHLEMTPRGAELLIEFCNDELGDGPYIQSPDQMRVEPDRFARTNRLMETVLQTHFQS